MSIQSLGDKYRVRVKRDDCKDRYLAGRYGHIYEYGKGKLGVIVSAPTGHRWKEARRKMLAAGFSHNQNGDFEGSCVFSSEDPAQMKIALGYIHPIRPRKLTPERNAHLQSCAQKAPYRGGVSVQGSIGTGRVVPRHG